MSSNNPRGGRGRPSVSIPAQPRPTDAPLSPNDFWSQLPTDKRQVMQSVFIQYRNQQIDYRQFLATSRDVLGEELYGQLYQRLSLAVPQRPSSQPTTPPIGATAMSMPSIASGAGSAQPVENTAGDDNDVDVMKIDAANLQDVMQYTGFDLRMEAESMSQQFMQPSAESRPREEDVRSMPQYYFNAAKMRSILSVYCRQFNVQEVDERVMEMLGLALQVRLRNILQLLVTISRHRVDYGRRLYKIKIENDPKKQFWLLERLRTNPPWKKSSSLDFTEPVSMDPNVLRAEQHPLLSNKETNQAAQAKKKPVGGSQSGLKKEDPLNLKTKMTNVTAMAAAGMKQRSWMTGKAAPMPISDDNIGGFDPSEPDPSTPSSPSEPHTEPINLANAPSSIPLTDADLSTQLRSRTINRLDFISACEHDHKLKRSKLHIQLLDLAPLVAASQPPPASQ